ncbi:uncharacterized protein LOC143780190 [Ranitomeya variabilis]|uniref:uncharacterized protein LOC143780190 n=1 Tax=Ranitomeya variabilis TaxID=490064 RepID=UPI0040579BDE
MWSSLHWWQRSDCGASASGACITSAQIFILCQSRPAGTGSGPEHGKSQSINGPLRPEHQHPQEHRKGTRDSERGHGTPPTGNVEVHRALDHLHSLQKKHT